jgi:carboxyl-terminal processing protease
LVVQTKGKVASKNTKHFTRTNPKDKEIPVIVMIDEYSASASEIVSGALQDLDRAVVIGSRSYGKGLVQTTYPVAFDGQLKVTIAKYYIPSGRCIQAIKYSPDPKQSPSYIPDSLTTQFKTRNGRLVRDGRGITPDIACQNDSIKGLLFHLLEQYKISDYALQYVKENPVAPAMEEFALTDSQFVDFKKFVLGSSFKFNSYSQDILNKFIEMSKLEECYEANKSLIDSLQSNLKQQNEPALDSIQSQIMQYLTSEIAKIYYYQWGEMYHILKTDKVVKQAMELFANRERYESLLASPKKQ